MLGYVGIRENLQIFSASYRCSRNKYIFNEIDGVQQPYRRPISTQLTTNMNN